MSETTNHEPLVVFRRRCKACGMPLAFVQQPSGRLAPMEVSPEGEVTDVNHFTSCPEAKSFKRERPTTPPVLPKARRA